ncbi:ANTAR domain-containing protein [Galbitalea sp. SE-J8]|uniref:ANTAR domain-containing protein n=1 Tax=Galbitalea sp. SE-J8 TaxID=3054952 RepID=UPI00259C85D5|nr:ANTAR domain-containing protein [Galbitalea sp. SE-J8]MDM4763424.1 ANTAR domain-containing protein [Galbitalea sp. SE-J8]
MNDRDPGDVDDILYRPFVDELPVDGAAVSTLGDPLGTETLWASDARAARVDGMLIDLGEGPTWLAASSRTPVLEGDLAAIDGGRWPVAHGLLRSMGVRGIFAFPLHVGALSLGAVDLFTVRPTRLSAGCVARGTALADSAARVILGRAVADLDAVDPAPADGPHSRREVHQATGMVAAQMRVSVTDARLVIAAHAYASGEPVLGIASEIVARRLSFEPSNDPT